MQGQHVRVRAVVAGLFASAVVAVGAGPAAAQSTVPTPTYQELFRPQFHFTPAQNWMNDPNGLVYYQGEYHMFYQYNPLGQVWGNMSWGHAISRDLAHWTELPVAIRFDEQAHIWSGSVVVDKENTSGFGTKENPPMVAIYSAAEQPGYAQAQSLAYSLDRGRTWTKYAGNPVLDNPDPDFRDPKVFWYEPTQRWIMPVALSIQRKIQFYSSPDLKDWTLEGDFGPEGAVAGVYEVPNLIPLDVKGPGSAERKWLLIVNVNPGARLGGSGAQYFIGDFDGRRFRSDDVQSYRPPTGDVLADFEGTDYGAWSVDGTAFGTGPSTGPAPGQRPIAGFQGSRFVNSRHPDTAAQGTLTSPAFEITRDFINLLVAGSDLPDLEGLPGEATVNLLVGGEVVRSTSGFGGEWLDWRSWDVKELQGKSARIQIVDRAATGHIVVDQITQADEAAVPANERARWVDWGRDFYAAITFENVPNDRQLLVGWINNWQYGRAIPTSPWRSIQSEPRDLSLREIRGTTELIQKPAKELQALRTSAAYRVRDRTVTGRRALLDTGSRGRALDIVANFDSGTANRFGLKVLVGNGEETIVGYDAQAQELFVDRTRSGNVGFHPQFASVSRAPLRLPRSGRLKLRVLVDHSVVEVFADQGQRVITDQVFPSASSDRVEFFAEGGNATVRSLNMWRMTSIWWPDTAG